MAEEGEGFLARWSRLKQARREDAPTGPPASQEATAAPAMPEEAGAPEPACEAEPEPEIDLASLPRLEDLTAASDLSVFLRRGVPAALRNAALRRVWSLDPEIRDFIGPADYAWDWNVPGGAPGYVADLAAGPDVEALADRILGVVRDAPGAADAPPERTADDERELAALPEPGPAPQEAALPAPPPPLPSPPAATPPERIALAAPPRPRHGGAIPS
jgi:hypothetical protein